MNNGFVRLKPILVVLIALIFVLLIVGLLRGIKVFKHSAERTAQPQEEELKKSAEIREAMNKGLEAVKAEDWELAMDYFRQALDIAPFDPTALFNLALASDKCGNHEFNSIAWYRAYLILKPDAQNADLVRSRIRDLEELIEERIRAFISQTEEAVRQIPSGSLEGWDWSDFWLVVEAELSLGDVSAAVKSCDLIPPDSMNKADFTSVIEALTKAEGVEAAREFLEQKVEQCKYNNLGVKNAGLSGIAKVQASMGEVSAAKETITAIDAAYDQSGACLETTRILLAQGDIAGALEIAEIFQQDEEYPLDIVNVYAEVVKAQVNAGDLKSARKTLKFTEESAWKKFKSKGKDYSAVTVSGGMPAFSPDAIEQFKEGDEYNRYCMLGILGEAQAAIGDIGAARKTITFIDNNYQPEDLPYRKVYKPLMLKGILSSIAIANIRFGKFSAAKKIIPQLTHESSNKAYLEMVKAKAQSGKFKQAEKIAAKIEPWGDRMEARRGIAEAKGEIAQAKVYKIYALATEESFYHQEEFRQLLYSVDSKDISDVVIKLGMAADDMSKVLKQLREIGP